MPDSGLSRQAKSPVPDPATVPHGVGEGASPSQGSALQNWGALRQMAAGPEDWLKGLGDGHRDATRGSCASQGVARGGSGTPCPITQANIMTP